MGEEGRKEKGTQDAAKVGNVPTLGGGFVRRVMVLCFVACMSVAAIHLHILNITSNIILKRATPLSWKVERAVSL